MGSGKGKTARGNKVRTPEKGKQAGVIGYRPLNVPLAKPYSTMQMYTENHVPGLQPKATKGMTSRMDD